MRIGSRSIHLPAFLSVSISALLVLVAVVRMMSYSRATFLGEIVERSPLRFLGYQPSSYMNTQFLKIIATPCMVAMQYFIFRYLNWSHTRKAPPDVDVELRRLDFESPWLRLVLTSLVTLHWVVIEAVKFANAEDFYPYSALEDRGLNMYVLLCSQAIAFLAMKYLHFGPLFEDGRKS